MSKDLKLIYLLMPIDYSSYQTVPVDTGWRVDITALSGLSKVSAVEVNGSSVPFTVVSDTLIQAFTDTDDIADLRLWADVPVIGHRQEVRMMVGTRPQQIEGLMKLVQQFILHLFKDPGTDVFEPEDGGGLYNFVQTVVEGNKTVVAGEVNRAVRQTVRQLQRKQRGLYLPPEETLAGVEVVSVEGPDDLGGGSFRVFLRLTSLAGPVEFGVRI